MEKKTKYEYVKEWRKNNPEKYKAQKKRARERKKEKESTKSIEEDRVQRLFHGIKKRCRENGICCDIKTYKEIEIPTHCPYLNIELAYDGSRGKNAASIDKIIPELGYTKGNIQIISMLANQMKSNATVEELLTFSQSIERLYNNNPPIVI